MCVERNNIYKYAESKNIKICDYSENKKLSKKITCGLGVLEWWLKLIK